MWYHAAFAQTLDGAPRCQGYTVAAMSHPVGHTFFPLYTSSEFSDVAVFLPTAEHGSSGGGEGSSFTDDAILGFVRSSPFFLTRPVGFRLIRNVWANLS